MQDINVCRTSDSTLRISPSRESLDSTLLDTEKSNTFGVGGFLFFSCFFGLSEKSGIRLFMPGVDLTARLTDWPERLRSKSIVLDVQVWIYLNNYYRHKILLKCEVVLWTNIHDKMINEISQYMSSLCRERFTTEYDHVGKDFEIRATTCRFAKIRNVKTFRWSLRSL